MTELTERGSVEATLPGLRAAGFFVVGCPRSGTTLFRLMLDSHPCLAIPPESQFLFTRPPSRSNVTSDAAVDAILTHQQFATWGLDPNVLREAVSQNKPRSRGDLVRIASSAYARAQGKARWGHKTHRPIPLLAGLFPDAQFLHIVRDGREVAASLADLGWATSAPVAAYWWRRRVLGLRKAGERLGPDRYYEVRLEDLVRNTQAALRAACDFLGMPFAPEMLDYFRTASERVDVSVVGQSAMQHVSRPPTPGLRDWRAGLSALDCASVESVCHRCLRTFGYPTTWRPRPRAVAYATALRAVDLSRTAREGLHRGLSEMDGGSA